MKYTILGREVDVNFVLDNYGLPSLKVDDNYVASLTADGKLLLSDVHEGAPFNVRKYKGDSWGVIRTINEPEFHNLKREMED